MLLAFNNLGRHYEDKGRYAEALAVLTKSLRIEANQPDVIHHWVFLRAKQCLWPIYEPLPGLNEEMMRRYTSALAMVSLSEDPEAQLAAARQYVRSKLDCSVPRLASAKPYGHKKLRVAYCSSDFCLHPVAMLTVELFERHDRDQFQIYGFDWSRRTARRCDRGSSPPWTISSAYTGLATRPPRSSFASTRSISSSTCRGGPGGTRQHVAYRPAPIQITYLGLPATTGLPSIDYVIADRFLIPESAVGYYSEKPLYMPDVYQVSDRQRRCGPAPSRESCGLPSDAFVFCSFNNNYKYTPETFRTWMSILRRVPVSVLWLLADNPWAQENLKNEALACDVEAQRLIFAPRVSPEDYLVRFALADLFLDTFQFNGGTTANDALWMGLPVLTRSGQTFASRMAGALLRAAELDELITFDLPGYEEKAVALASAYDKCRHMRAHLQKVREQGALFDTPRFVRNLETEFKRLMAEREWIDPTRASLASPGRFTGTFHDDHADNPRTGRFILPHWHRSLHPPLWRPAQSPRAFPLRRCRGSFLGGCR